jgi:hypothetical protein
MIKERFWFETPVLPFYHSTGFSNYTAGKKKIEE